MAWRRSWTQAKLSPLQQLGIEAQAVTSLVELLQKKKSKRSPKERTGMGREGPQGVW